MRFGIRVQVRDSAIFEKGGCGCRCGGTRRLKNYYKYFYLYFLYIFTIKIFLKNTYYALIHKKKKEEGKFRLFQPYSRPISAVSDMFWPYRLPADTTRYGRYGPILAESARFGTNRSRFGTNRAALVRIREKKNVDAV